jgi:TRAP-type transport system periplasmic protein
MKTSELKARRALLVKATSGCLALAFPYVRTARGQQAEHKMVFAHTFSPATEKFVATGIDVFKTLAEKYSDGKLMVDVHDSGKLGGQNVLPQKLQSGLIQACQLSMQNFAPFSESFNLLDMPYLFASSQAFERVLDSDWFAQSKFAAEPLSKGFRLVPGMWANAGYRVLGVNKRRNHEVHLPDDMKGMKIRVNPARVEQQAWALTPASQVTIAWAETYQAMEQGVADALNVGMGPLAATKIEETLSSATFIDMTFNAHVTVVSSKWHQSLPKNIQAAIDRAGLESSKHQKEQQRLANDRMVAGWKKAGIKLVTLSPDERKAWVNAVGHTRPDWSTLKDRYGRAEYAKLLELGSA